MDTFTPIKGSSGLHLKHLVPVGSQTLQFSMQLEQVSLPPALVVLNIPKPSHATQVMEPPDPDK